MELMESHTSFQTVLQAVDNATATLQKVSDGVNKLSEKIDKNTEASKKGNNAFADMAKYAEAIGLVKLTDEFINLTKEAVNFAVETSSAFETSKAQFDVLLGSAHAGSQMMQEL